MKHWPDVSCFVFISLAKSSWHEVHGAFGQGEQTLLPLKESIPAPPLVSEAGTGLLAVSAIADIVML